MRRAARGCHGKMVHEYDYEFIDFLSIILSFAIICDLFLDTLPKKIAERRPLISIYILILLSIYYIVFNQTYPLGGFI